MVDADFPYTGVIIPRRTTSNLMTLPKKNHEMNQILNHHIDFMAEDRPSPLGAFYEQRHLNQK